MTSDKEGREHLPKTPSAAPKRSLKPRPKVAAAGSAGAATTLAVFIASQFGLDVTPEVASAATVLISTAAGYFLPDSYVKG